MAEQLNLTINSFESTHHHKHPDIRSNDVRTRIGNDTLLEFLQDRFRRDIELYEWSKTLAVLQCEEASPSVDESPSDATSEPESAIELPPETNASDPDLVVDFEGASLLETSQQRQIASFKNGTALILNIHITNHAGTSVCHFMSHAGPTPEFACMGPDKGNENSPWPEGLSEKYRPEGMNETQDYVGRMRPYFYFVSWEYRGYAHLQTVDWEYPNLVSMIVMRDPLERFLAGGKCGRYHVNKPPPYALKGDPDPSNQDIYWLYANDPCADNYALRVLADDPHCVNGTRTSVACLESAKDLLRRFTFVLDQSCLADSMAAVADRLGLESGFQFESGLHHKHDDVKTRIGNDTLLEFLRDRFRRDIELYEWSKTLVVLQCEEASPSVDESSSDATSEPESAIELPPETNASDPDLVVDFEGASLLETSQQRQIASYKNGTALILNIHITHHAGTSVCHFMKHAGPTPEFACMGPDKGNENSPWPEGLSKKYRPEGMNETQDYVGRMRPYFHFVSWEFRGYAHLQTVDWEYPDLVSMIVMRDPLERFLAGGKCGRYHAHKPPPYSLKGDPDPSNQDIYWLYANDPCADNYALRVLADDPHCVNGTFTSVACLESAKDLLRRFTFVLDQSCLADSMAAVADRLGLESGFQFESGLHHKHDDVRTRIGNDTLLEFLRDRFRRDIELYEWSKTMAVLQCGR